MAATGLDIRYKQDAEFFCESPRPRQVYHIRRCDVREWAKFSRYHYLNNDISHSCRCFGLYYNEEIVGFCVVLHQPHGRRKNLKRCSRIVILPDYQGIGLGTKFLETVARYYADNNYQFSIVTSAKNMIAALNKSKNWKMIRYSTNNCESEKSRIDYKRKSLRNNCKTASFFFVKHEEKPVEEKNQRSM